MLLQETVNLAEITQLSCYQFHNSIKKRCLLLQNTINVSCNQAALNFMNGQTRLSNFGPAALRKFYSQKRKNYTRFHDAFHYMVGCCK
jgi:hypothetical protein